MTPIAQVLEDLTDAYASLESLREGYLEVHNRDFNGAASPVGPWAHPVNRESWGVLSHIIQARDDLNKLITAAQAEAYRQGVAKP